jgi:hypothetical protein
MTSARVELPPAAPRRRRRAWPVVTIAIVLLVLIVAFFVADAAAKAYAQDKIRTQLVSALGLPASAEVAVDLGPGSILLQALTGSVSAVDVSVPKLAFGELVGAASIHATKVPLDTSKPLGTLSVSYAVTEKNIGVLAKNLSGVGISSVSLTAPEIVANASFALAGTKIPIALGLQPSVNAGQLVFTPTTVGVSGQSFTAKQLAASPIFGSLARSLLKQQSFCVAQYLPRGLTATSAKVVGTSLVLSFSGDGTAIGGADFSTKGSCA